ncbi:MAG: cupin domain-containing protein [Gemmatimonadaceae bacterium]
MNTVKHYNWKDVPSERLTPLLSRKLITGERLMIAQVFLSTGSIVPAHDHHNEQITYIVSGCLRFWIGEHADSPGAVYVDVRAGEVLTIPSMVRHRAEALEDTLDVDVFNPPRQDWLDGSDAYIRQVQK